VIFVLAAIAMLVLSLGPQLWIRWVFFRYKSNLPDIPGTGAELAQHLLKRFAIEGVAIEETKPQGDHFDSATPAIRLSPDNFNGRSLTAIAVAAHEVGHAIQWHRKEEIFRLRSRYIPLAMKLQRIGLMASRKTHFARRRSYVCRWCSRLYRAIVALVTIVAQALAPPVQPIETILPVGR